MFRTHVHHERNAPALDRFDPGLQPEPTVLKYWLPGSCGVVLMPRQIWTMLNGLQREIEKEFNVRRLSPAGLVLT